MTSTGRALSHPPRNARSNQTHSSSQRIIRTTASITPKTGSLYIRRSLCPEIPNSPSILPHVHLPSQKEDIYRACPQSFTPCCTEQPDALLFPDKDSHKRINPEEWGLYVAPTNNATYITLVHTGPGVNEAQVIVPGGLSEKGDSLLVYTRFRKCVKEYPFSLSLSLSLSRV